MTDKRSAKDIARETAQVLSYADQGKTGKLLAELNKIKPEELSQFAKELEKQSKANSQANRLPEAHVVETIDSKPGKDQPRQLVIETHPAGKPYSILGLHYDTPSHKWQAFDFLTAKAKTVEDIAAENSSQKNLDKIASELNKIPERALADFIRTLHNLASDGSNNILPEAFASKEGPTKSGGYEPTQVVFESKLERPFSVEAYSYDSSKQPGHRWSHDEAASKNARFYRMGRHSYYAWQDQWKLIKEMPARAKESGERLHYFFSYQALIDKLNQMSRGATGGQ